MRCETPGKCDSSPQENPTRNGEDRHLVGFYVIVPLRGTHFQPFGKDGHTRHFHFCGNEVGSNRRSLLPSSLHSG